MRRVVLLEGIKLRVSTWAQETRCPVQSFLDSQTKSHQKKIWALVQRAADTWPMPLRNPQKCRALRGEEGLFELKSGQVRLLFFFEHSGSIVLSSGFWKRQDRTPQREIDRAVRIRDLWQSGRETQE